MKRSDKKRALRAAASEPSVRVRWTDPTLRADAGEDGPSWNMVFPRGTFHRGDFPGGAITFDTQYFATIIANWKKRGKPELATDYHHRGPSDVEVPNSEKVASGRFTDLETRVDGLWALWSPTDAAREKVRAGELLYFSPDWFPNGTDVSTGLKQGPTLCGAGLLIDPFFQEMPRVAAGAVADPPANPAVTEHAMNRAQIDAMLKKAGISLVASATDAEAIAALDKHLEASAKAVDAAKVTGDSAAAALKAKDTAEANEKALRAQLAEVTEDKAKLGVRVANIEKARKDEQVELLCKRAISEGRITAAAQQSVKDLAEVSGIEKATAFVETFAKSKVAPVGKELGHGEGTDDDVVDQSEKVRAAAAEERVKNPTLSGAAAIRAAAMKNADVVKSLARPTNNPPPKN